MTAAELERLKAKCEAATPGPWEYWAEMCGWRIKTADRELTGIQINPHFAHNMQFVTAARTAVPALIAEVERLQERVEGLESEVGALEDQRYDEMMEAKEEWS
jgi:hypothetical protein